MVPLVEAKSHAGEWKSANPDPEIETFEPRDEP